MADLNERVAALEEGQKHIATKADLAEVKATLISEIASIDGQLEILAWAIPLVVAVILGLFQLIPYIKSLPKAPPQQ